MQRKNESILVVDDVQDTLEVISRNLKSGGYNVFTAAGVAPALDILKSHPVNLVITDYKMPESNGLDLIRHVKENYKNTEVVMITGYATIENAVAAIKTGAREYISKPFTDEELLSTVAKVLERQRSINAGQGGDDKQLSKFGLIGRSKAIKTVRENIEKACSTPATVLINGESGTGKELVARAIHYNSDRASAPFVPVNCGAIPENLLDSELFGHVKGAFTGAAATRAGFFQTAEKGTIFLDEISDTSQAMQSKLLRVLEAREVCMVGSSLPRKVDVRILAASNKNLQKLVKKELFREDLFYRLNVLNIQIPPLRERESDVLLLIRNFLKKFADEYSCNPPKFTDNALNALERYDWPGNVRELENLIHRIVVMNGNKTIDVPDLPSYMRFSAQHSSGLNRTLKTVETEHVKNVLAGVEGNISKAARILDIDRKTLRRKLESQST